MLTTRRRILAAAVLAVCIFASGQESSSVYALSETFTVTSTNDVNDGDCDPAPGHCSLREALNHANNNDNGDIDTITFDLPGAGPWVITPSALLPTISEGVTINGFCATCNASANTNSTSQPINADYNIVLNGSGAGDDAYGFLIVTTQAVTIRGLVIGGWDRSAILVTTNGNHVIAGNFIGTSLTGTGLLANGIGVEVTASSNLQIGGQNAADRNLISGNSTYGIRACAGAADGITIRGNFIGPSATGAGALINGIDGISLCFGEGHLVGGNATQGNVISGNLGNGVSIANSEGAIVRGNRIGTTAAGLAALPNGGNGVYVFSSEDVDVGGVGAGQGNVISGNLSSGLFGSLSPGLRVRENIVGFAASGTTAIPNGNGGLSLFSITDGLVAGNNVGNNIGSGISLGGAIDGLAVVANTIGTLGGEDSGNTLDGIRVTNASTDLSIGGDLGGRNYIVFNGGNGIRVQTGPHFNFTIMDNEIGTVLNAAAGNGGAGIIFDSTATGFAQIGGSNQGNVIRFNGTDGVGTMADDAIVTIRYNRISENGNSANHLPIDLESNGPAANDPGDADTGANGLQNYPLFAESYSNYFRLTLASLPVVPYTIDLYEAICVGGKAQPIAHIASGGVVTPGNGLGGLVFQTTTDFVTPGSFVTATATDNVGATSEVNPACTPAPPAVIMADIGGLDFYPQNRLVPRGTDLPFLNRHFQSHLATSDDGEFPSFTTGNLNSGEDTTLTFDTAGVFTYHCEYHPAMTGTITVTGNNPDPDITFVSDGGLFAGADARVTILGDGFISGSQVTWDNALVTWEFDIHGDISAQIPAALLTTPGIAKVRITNPNPVDPDGKDAYEVLVHRAPADVECDIDVDGNDALAALRKLAGFTIGLLPHVCAVEPVNPAGDANGDGEETVEDVLYIRNWAAGILD